MPIPNAKICLMFHKDAESAARFYAGTFPMSSVGAIHRAPADYPSGKAGDVLTVEFTVLGIPCIGVNAGPYFKPSEAFSFQIATNTQEETDNYWNAIVKNGGDEAKRAFNAMMTMKKIDVAAIDAARKGPCFSK